MRGDFYHRSIGQVVYFWFFEAEENEFLRDLIQCAHEQRQLNTLARAHAQHVCMYVCMYEKR